MLSWLRFFLNTNTLFSLFNIFIDPFLKFCWISWGNAYVSVYFLNFILFHRFKLRVFAGCWGTRQRNVFLEKICYAFQGKKKPSKGAELGSDYRLL